MIRRGVKKADILRSSAPPPHDQLFVNFFVCVFFILDYDSMSYETVFTKKESIFMQLLESPIPPLTAAHLIVGGYF